MGQMVDARMKGGEPDLQGRKNVSSQGPETAEKGPLHCPKDCNGSQKKSLQTTKQFQLPDPEPLLRLGFEIDPLPFHILTELGSQLLQQRGLLRLIHRSIARFVLNVEMPIHLIEEARGRYLAHPTLSLAIASSAQNQMLLSPGHTHIKESTLFTQICNSNK